MNTAIAVQEKPILFSGAMVRAIIEGRKTQTRRVMKPQPFLERSEKRSWWLLDHSEGGYGRTNSAWEEGKEPFWTYCPYGKPGDRLWVREAFAAYIPDYSPNDEYDEAEGKLDREFNSYSVVYAADKKNFPDRWRPSIHMPRWASRLTLEIVSVKVERVQEISEADAIAEGVKFGTHEPGECRTCGRGAFMDLWNSINEKRGFGWEKNPWVWAIEFKRLDT